MPRQARLDAPGVLQHVMARGIERRKIFRDDKDHVSFVERLALILEETQTQCYAWALIPNHFHLLLRPGPTPLSTVMRRLMTGHAVTFNKRHKRSGHLFQNRYRSIVCEEDAYLLELTRYIHLNPLRAKLVKDLKELDKYLWNGHSALLGKRKNPLIPKLEKEVYPMEFKDHSTGAKINPENPVNPACPVGAKHRTGVQENKSLAEKTVEDVLRYFGDSISEARANYRRFVEKGIKKGRRPEFQGGGLLRSAGGGKRLIRGKSGERELSDERILGSGYFVSQVLKEANELKERKKSKISLDKLIEKVTEHMGIKMDALLSSSRKKELSKARAIISFFAIEEFGYSASDVSRYLKLSRVSTAQCAERGKKIVDIEREIRNVLEPS